MRKKENHEEKLISNMMTHLEINKPGREFTNKVMDRVSYEPMPSRITYKPLISRSAWIVIGLLLSILLVLLIASISAGPVVPAADVPSSTIHLPDFGSYGVAFMEWLRESSGSLVWYSLGMASLFILTALDRILKRPRIRHGFVL